YRALPNGTDLSEGAVLGLPALNFAFAKGVERYHTTHDDVAHLDPGSVQHHGAQMLAVAGTLASGPLPRPVTGDANFFDLPFIGLVIYPIWLAIPLAIVALVLAIVVVWRTRRGIVVGALALLVTAVVCGFAARLINLSGPARWSG